ncbi:HK97 gp10 family phage protein [Klebsiella aerogenes]|uniref:HK97 gp10 family phage protein n=1 Tax=Klebsiella aerogenes TaxID=548 RepID=UPI003A7FD1BA
MGVKVRGIEEAKSNIERMLGEVKGRKMVRAIYSALDLAANRAATYTPMDTSTLLNSQFREINVNGTRVTGRVGYSANYAAFVHEMPGKLKGQPRAHFGQTRSGKKFGGGSEKGNYWGPHGEPQFLKKGFDEERDAITAVIKKELSL